DTDGPRLVGDRAGDRLPDPPSGIGGELVAAAVLELIDGLHQADIALLDEVQKLQASVRVLFRDRDDEAEIGFDHLLLRLARFTLAFLDGRHDAAEVGQRQAALDTDLRDAAPDGLDRFRMVADELLPLRLLADPTHPLRIDLAALPFGDKGFALHPALHGEAEHPAFQPHDLLVKRVEPADQLLDPSI